MTRTANVWCKLWIRITDDNIILNSVIMNHMTDICSYKIFNVIMLLCAWPTMFIIYFCSYTEIISTLNNINHFIRQAWLNTMLSQRIETADQGINHIKVSAEDYSTYTHMWGIPYAIIHLMLDNGDSLYFEYGWFELVTTDVMSNRCE